MDNATIGRLAQAVHPFAVATRRHLHQHPELSFQETETSRYLAAQLRLLGLEPQTGLGGGNGIKVVIGGGRPGRTVALRADMDALPIHEETGLPFASQHPGVMHACGHDVHTATLLATAKALLEVRVDLPGTVVLLFQPGEELDPGGASLMIADGCLENPHVDAIFGLHINPYEDVGTVLLAPGALYASPDDFVVTIRGQGGHAAAPHIGVDPIVTAAQVILGLQTIVSRNTNPFDQAVITIGSIHGGAASNVIPDTVTLSGTIRTMNPAIRKQLPQRLEQVVRGVCEAAGATYEVQQSYGYPVLVNDGPMTERAQRAARAIFAPEQVLAAKPTMGAEDFAYYLEQRPGSYAKIGCSTPGQERHGLHTSRLLVDEACMETGVAYFLSVVREFLGA